MKFEDSSNVLHHLLDKCTEALSQDPKNPDILGEMAEILISLNRIMFRKLIDVNRNYINILVSYGLIQEAEETLYPTQIVDGLARLLKNMKTFPNVHVSPHELRGTLIHEGEPNSSMVFIQEGKVRLTMLARDEETEEEERVGRVIGYRVAVQSLLRNLQRYPETFEHFFRLLLELNYFRTARMMQKTTEL